MSFSVKGYKLILPCLLLTSSFLSACGQNREAIETSSGASESREVTESSQILEDTSEEASEMDTLQKSIRAVDNAEESVEEIENLEELVEEELALYTEEAYQGTSPETESEVWDDLGEVEEDEEMMSTQQIGNPISLSVSTGKDEKGNDTFTVVFSELPSNVSQLQAMPSETLQSPEQVAALSMAALYVYPTSKEACFDMLEYLNGPETLNEYTKQFLRDRFSAADYVIRSYFAGTSPENNYQPTQPYTVTFIKTPYSENSLSQGYLTLYCQSSGADSLREIKLRQKPSTGEWFYWDQMLLVGIRVPAEADPWA